MSAAHRSAPEALLAQLEAAIEAQFGSLDEFGFVQDCPFVVCDRTGGVAATDAAYQALAAITYVRWLRDQEAQFQRARTILQRRNQIRVVGADAPSQASRSTRGRNRTARGIQ